MRYSMIVAIALAANSIAAAAEDSPWGYYQDEKVTNGLLQAGVQSADGSQFIIKCDKKGKSQVMATFVSPTARLTAPNSRFIIRPISIRFDDQRPTDDRWRYFDNTATAADTKNEHAMSRLVANGFADAKTMMLRFDPQDGNPFEASFPIAGARDALKKVYESCGDDFPG